MIIKENKIDKYDPSNPKSPPLILLFSNISN